MNETKERGRCLAYGLGTLQVFIGLGGVSGGWGLISEPNGANLGFPLELLDNTPFTNYLIPGIVLLAINGVGSLAGGILSFKRHSYASNMAIALGAFLMGWITAQVWWIGYSHWLQPLFFGFGLVELALGLLLRRACHATNE